MTKLRNNRGETLIEVLASILIAALSVALLFSFTITSSTMEKKAQEEDEGHYGHIAAAEAGPDAPSPMPITGGQVIITDESGTLLTTPIPVNIYGGDGMFSYRRQP